jgi:hypothetical protein
LLLARLRTATGFAGFAADEGPAVLRLYLRLPAGAAELRTIRFLGAVAGGATGVFTGAACADGAATFFTVFWDTAFGAAVSLAEPARPSPARRQQVFAARFFVGALAFGAFAARVFEGLGGLAGLMASAVFLRGVGFGVGVARAVSARSCRCDSDQRFRAIRSLVRSFALFGLFGGTRANFTAALRN